MSQSHTNSSEQPVVPGIQDSEATMSAEDRRNARLAAISGFFGSTIEYFDFVCFATASALVFNKVFFAGFGAVGGTIASFATFGVAYIARPLGAIIFGTLGDRLGRTHTLIITLLLMGTATFLVGCLPTPQTIGIAAPIALVVLRLAQGLSAGGEQAGSNSLSSENAPKEKRGVFTGWTMIGVAVGTMLGSVAFVPITAMGEEFLLGFGWRIPFLAAGPLMLFTLWIRAKVKEPKVFTEQKAMRAQSKAKESVPLAEVLRYHWKNLLRVIVCSLYALMGSMTSVFGLTYATQYAGLESAKYLGFSSILGLVIIPISLAWAWISDKIGRRPVYIISVLSLAVLFPVLFATMHTHNWALILGALAVLQLLGCGGNIVQAPMYTEMFPSRVRYTGYALGTQIGLIVVGFAPTIAAALVKPGPMGWVPVAIFIAVCMVMAAISAFTARETKGLSIEELER
ncbi:major facilitator transporter [Bifidobacterium margollesii]|uniref:Major facilitator transporter n=1 Tax=Bifidobacterium margollesii TaxID=2020964 RepID=A0A2N5JAY4_9BIFI|nr:MFS transporter [Bifidobacterium margollesii]PLS31372.1 major facilitator transporter [Bifidobacterium margollesii]